MFYSVKVLSYTSIVNTRDTLTQWSFQPGSHYQCQTDIQDLLSIPSQWQAVLTIVIYSCSKFMKNPKSYAMKFKSTDGMGAVTKRTP